MAKDMTNQDIRRYEGGDFAEIDDNYTNRQVQVAIANRAGKAVKKVKELEDKVEEIINNPDVVDIVATYADLQAYDTSHLHNNDIIRVLADETHDGDSSYYRFNKSAGTWTYIASVEASDVNEYVIKGAGAPTTATVGTVGMLYEDTTNGKLYQCTAVTPGTDPDPDTYTWEEVGGSSINVVQTKGTSQTDVMSQNATTSMVFADPSTVRQVRIGNTSSNLVDGSIVIGRNAANYTNNGGGSAGPTVTIGNSATTYSASAIAIGGSAKAGNYSTNLIGVIAIGNSSQAGYGSSSGNDSIAIGTSAKASTGQGGGYGGIAIGASAQAENRGSIALGVYSKTSATGEMNIGSTSTSHGYNSSNYRLLTGVYDPQSAHDAATKGYVDTQIGTINTALQTLLNGTGV